jgi:uncharacterized membrane protein (UPF0127 family)
VNSSPVFRIFLAKRTWPDAYDALWFPHCASVHTCFTFLRPDLLFLDRDYVILSLFSRAKPFRFWFGPSASYGCLEIPPGAAKKHEWWVGVSLEKYFLPEDELED